MNPIWRYVKAVERDLPKAHRVETVGALYATLKRRKKILEREKGRRLTPDEVAAMLKDEGAPADVAARYAMPEAAGDVLVQRYLAAVERRLPEEQAQDIVAELREAIAGKIEGREEAEGRALSREEIAPVLKDFGHPNIVASRYAGRDYLIGPQLYPWFWQAQRMAVGATVAVLIVLGAIGALDSARPIQAFLQALSDVWGAALLVFAIVTVVFVIMERTDAPATFGAKWDPRQLPADHVRAPKSLFESIVSIVFDVIFILWWAKLIDFPNRLPTQGDASVELHFSAAWEQVWWPIMILALLSAAVHASDIFYPAWNRVRSAVSIVGHVAGVVVIAVLISSGPLIDVIAIEGGDTRAETVQWWVDGPFRWALATAAAISAIAAGVEVWRQFMATPSRTTRELPA